MESLGFPLSELFTAQGALVGAAAITVVVQLIKKFVPFLPSGGPAVLALVAVLAAGLTALAVADAGDPITAQSILTIVMTWAAVATAAVGTFEAGAAVATAATAEEKP